jgi:hypothetical protein
MAIIRRPVASAILFWFTCLFRQRMKSANGFFLMEFFTSVGTFYPLASIVPRPRTLVAAAPLRLSVRAL